MKGLSKRGPVLVTLELLLDDRLEALLLDGTLEGTLLDEMLVDEDEVATELDGTLDELVVTELDATPQPATTPKGEGWEAQVVLEMQLLPFS